MSCAAHFLRLCLQAGHTPQSCLCECPCHSSAVSVPVSSLFIPFAASAMNAEIKRTFLSGFPRRTAESSIFCSQTRPGHLDNRAHAPHGSGLYRVATLIFCQMIKTENPAFIFILFCGEQEAKADWSPGPVTIFLTSIPNIFIGLPKIIDPFCKPPCDYSPR
jgi:hypothetical protein